MEEKAEKIKYGATSSHSLAVPVKIYDFQLMMGLNISYFY
jgi:hypothetical protein